MFGCCQRFRELLLEMPPKRVFRESKGAEEEEYLDNVQSLETIVVNMSAKSSSFCLIKFFEEVCKENGVYYPPRGLQSICRGLQLHLEDQRKQCNRLCFLLFKASLQSESQYIPYHLGIIRAPESILLKFLFSSFISRHSTTIFYED